MATKTIALCTRQHRTENLSTFMPFARSAMCSTFGVFGLPLNECMPDVSRPVWSVRPVCVCVRVHVFISFLGTHKTNRMNFVAVFFLFLSNFRVALLLLPVVCRRRSHRLLYFILFSLSSPLRSATYYFINVNRMPLYLSCEFVCVSRVSNCSRSDRE